MTFDEFMANYGQAITGDLKWVVLGIVVLVLGAAFATIGERR